VHDASEQRRRSLGILGAANNQIFFVFSVLAYPPENQARTSGCHMSRNTPAIRLCFETVQALFLGSAVIETLLIFVSSAPGDEKACGRTTNPALL
jgi:hypothetical protein